MGLGDKLGTGSSMKDTLGNRGDVVYMRAILLRMRTDDGTELHCFVI